MAGGKELSKGDPMLPHGPFAYISGNAQHIAIVKPNDDFPKDHERSSVSRLQTRSAARRDILGPERRRNCTHRGCMTHPCHTFSTGPSTTTDSAKVLVYGFRLWRGACECFATVA